MQQAPPVTSSPVKSSAMSCQEPTELVRNIFPLRSSVGLRSVGDLAQAYGLGIQYPGAHIRGSVPEPDILGTHRSRP